MGSSTSSRKLKSSTSSRKLRCKLRPSRRSAHLDSAGEILCFATAQQTRSRNSTFDIFKFDIDNFDILNSTCFRSCTTPPAVSLSNLEFDTRSFFVFCLFSSFHFLMLQQEERFSTAENPTLWKTSTAHRKNAKATLPRSRQCTNSRCHQAFGRFFP